MRTRVVRLLALCGALSGVSGVVAQEAFKLDAAARSRTVNGVLLRLREGYVFPEVAEKMEKAVRDRAASGAYDAITDGEAFARELTRDLR
ncbi:MAG TPA: hypothetical protein VK689_01545, partial [Armatimonadota bacterium]|nr:hypothetical protein [Armatimonadota bacterium]